MEATSLLHITVINTLFRLIFKTCCFPISAAQGPDQGAEVGHVPGQGRGEVGQEAGVGVEAGK